jgi:hypothetical protein
MTATTTSRGVTFRRPTLDEKSEQANIKLLVGHLGGRVYTLGTRRAQYCGTCGCTNTDQGTRQTEGLGDLAIYLPPSPRQVRANPDAPWVFLWVECKGRGGTLTPEQVEFRYINQRAGVVSLVGGLDAFLEWLSIGGWAR